MSEPERIQAETASVEGQVVALASQASNPDKVQAQFASAVDISSTLALRYPAEVLPAGLNETVREAAKQAGIDIAGMAPIVPSDPVIGGAEVTAETGDAAAGDATTTTNAQYATVTLTVTLTATLDQINAFVEKLPRQTRGLVITSVQVTPSGPETPNQFVATMNCTSLLLKPIPQPNSPAVNPEPAN